MSDPDGPDDLLSELDLGPEPLGLPARRSWHVAHTRDLGPADLEAHAARPAQPGTSSIRPLTRIHASHHAVARCLASGMKAGQVALVTGYTAVRINQLQQDAAFQALLAEYRAESSETFAALAERMNNLGLDAIELLHERVLEDPGSLTVPLLLDIVKTFADRTGHGPGQEVNLNVRPMADPIDRPPRETYEQWRARRGAELAAPPGEARHERSAAGEARHEGRHGEADTDATPDPKVLN